MTDLADSLWAHYSAAGKANAMNAKLLGFGEIQVEGERYDQT